ncbi:MAG: ABC transporter related protein [Parcubacteria group bacterium GW2011_GWC2_38_7]|nr:MAG: ABC transporter related protein [Parcubacteria group bacterium GW2011_GWC2_38_7]
MGYFLTQLARIAENVAMSIGCHLTIAVGNIFFLGGSTMFCFGAYAVAISQKAGLDPWLSAIVAVLCSLVFSFLFVLAYIRLSNDSFTVFTLASMLAFEALVKSWDTVTGGVLGIAGIMRPEYIDKLKELVIFQVIIMIILLIVEYVILKTFIGRSLLGMRESKHFVESLGTSTKLIGGTAIVIGSVMAAIAGVTTVWRVQFLDASFGSVTLLVLTVTIAVLAAKPKIRWLMLSAIFVTFLPEVFRFLPIPSIMLGHLRIFMYSVMLIIVLLTISKKLMPQKRVI